jgi:hypothetical protein
MDRISYSRQFLLEQMNTPADIFMLMSQEEIRAISAILGALEALGAETLVRDRITDLSSQNGHSAHGHFSKFLLLGIAAAVGVLTCNNLATMLTLNFPFGLQSIAALAIGGLIGAGSEWVGALVIGDMMTMLYRRTKEKKLHRSLREAKTDFRFRHAFFAGQIDVLRVVECEFMRPHLLLGFTLILIVEAIAGLAIGYAASEDVLQSIIVGLTPLTFILTLSSFSAHLSIIPEQQDRLLKAYKHHWGRWQFVGDEETPSRGVILLPAPRRH